MPSASPDLAGGPNSPNGPCRLRWLLNPWWPIAVGILCFLNTLGNALVYDDTGVVERNPRIRSLANWQDIWLTDWWRVIEERSGELDDPNPQRDRLYRPVPMQTFALQYALHGLDPVGYHIVNVLLHGAACGLVWVFSRRITGSDVVATIAALWFAAHPVHVEAVAQIVGRAEILATLGLLAGLIALYPANSTPGWGRGLIAAGAFLFALLCKESAICYLPVALVALWALPANQRGGRGWWGQHALLLIVPLLVYLPLRYTALEGQLFRSEPVNYNWNPLRDTDMLTRVFGTFTILGHYARLLVLPTQLNADYGYAVFDPERGFTMLTFLGMTAAAALLVGLAGLTTRRPTLRLAGVLCAMFLFSYALISNSVLLIGVTVAERLVYWPSVIVILLLSVVIYHAWQRYTARGRPLASLRRITVPAAVALLMALALRSGVRNTDWRDNYTLFNRDVALHRHSVQLNLGAAKEMAAEAAAMTDADLRVAMLRQAELMLQRVLHIDPSSVHAMVSRARVLAALGQLPAAQAQLEAALQIAPDDREARTWLLQVRQNLFGDEQSLGALSARVTAAPDDVAARLALAKTLIERGEPDDALPHLQHARRIAPDNADVVRQLSGAYLLTGQPDAAREVLMWLITRDPANWDAHTNLSRLYADAGDAARALYHAEQATAQRPADPRPWMNLAEAYVLNDRRDEAVQLFHQILSGLPPGDPLSPIIEQRIKRLRSQ
jgi:tetratricopeptide (TPR) repeat protein